MAFPQRMSNKNNVDSTYTASTPTESFGGALLGPYTANPFEASPRTPSEQRTTLHRRFTSETMTPSTRESVPRSGLSSRDVTAVEFEAQQRYKEFAQKRDEQAAVTDAIHRLTLQSQQNMQEMVRMHEDLQKVAIMKVNSGSQYVDPATPPEASAFMDRLHPDMHSASGVLLETPPSKRHEVQQLQLMTPPADDLHGVSHSTSSAGSRRNSDENEKKSGYDQTPTPAGHVRNMSIGRDVYSHSSQASVSRSLGNGLAGFLGQNKQNTSGYMFGTDVDDKALLSSSLGTSSPDSKPFHLQVNATEENFPILVRRDSYPATLSPPNNGLDQGFTHNGMKSAKPAAWPIFARHSRAQQSLPVNTYHASMSPTAVNPSQDVSGPKRFENVQDTAFGNLVDSNRLGGQFSLQPSDALATRNIPAMPKLQSSFSTSDLPTMRNFSNPVRSVAESHQRDTTYEYQNAAATGAFGPALLPNRHLGVPPGMQPTQSAGGYGQYFQPPGTMPYHPPGYQMPNFSGKNDYANGSSRTGSGHQKRISDAEEQRGGGARFASIILENSVAEVYSFCKDQHGCRYLQKKLEEKNPLHLQIIFEQTNAHVVELMTDPFGNYLCQKLLEYANDEQRTVLVDTAAPHLVEIALNQHGTRALQKMIEFISTPGQIQTVMQALQSKVVLLIQDLNGNHVIQKCLNRLVSADAQFIYDAVGENCVQVGTHRHGCCVLQRCIDHASEAQKVQLIGQVTQDAFALVQDAYGNYVVQYILDLGDTNLSDTLIRQFLGHVRQLSKEKFSSNVIEKCIRVAEADTKTLLIEEMMSDAHELDRLVRDNYANYVVQTALEYAEPVTKERLVEAITPILPAIRMTPYGRRIISKISGQGGSAFGQSNSYSSGSQGVPGVNNGFRSVDGSGQAQPRTFPAYLNYAPNILRSQGLQSTAIYRPPFATAVSSPGNPYY